MIVLDTHALLWWVSSDARLSPQAEAAVSMALPERAVLVSSFSVWEIALLVSQGRVGLEQDLDDWLKELSRVPGLSFVPVDNAIAIQSINLPGDFHKDPADRIIVATARVFRASIITADAKIRNYPHVKSIW